jgi:hypothetical protein
LKIYFVASTFNKIKVELLETDGWKLEQLYIDLASVKGKTLTPVEKRLLRELLCGYSPAEIADRVFRTRNSNIVRVYLSNGLYKYIEILLGDRARSAIEIKNWSHAIQLLEEASYREFPRGSIRSRING